MEEMEKYTKGLCMEMCPKSELNMRERQRLLHVLEVVPGTEKSKFPRADPDRAVKSFSRSAAGKQVNITQVLRPPNVLLKTVSYLLMDVINDQRLSWCAVYDFITDRLMAVRQDMVVQNVPKAESICLLQPIVRFHAYAAYRLCNENPPNFDAVVNNRHLQECLKRLLYFYDAVHFQLHMNSNFLMGNRPEFEALYILLNLGHDEALRRILSIPRQYNTNVVKDAFNLSIAFRHGNFVRACRIMKRLPALLAAITSLHLNEIRRKAFQVLSTAYHSKNLSYSKSVIKTLLLYGADNELLDDTKYYGIRSERDCLYFTKQSFQAVTAVCPRHEHFVRSKFMKENLESIIFGFQDSFTCP